MPLKTYLILTTDASPLVFWEVSLLYQTICFLFLCCAWQINDDDDDDDDNDDDYK